MRALLFKEMGMSTVKAQLGLMGHPCQPFPLRLRARHGREGGKDGKDQRTGRTAVTFSFPDVTLLLYIGTHNSSCYLHTLPA